MLMIAKLGMYGFSPAYSSVHEKQFEKIDRKEFK